MNTSTPIEWPQHQTHADTSNIVDRQISPTLSFTSPSFPDSAASDAVYLSPQDQRDDALSSKADSATSSKIKKKFSELDIRGAMADLDIRKSGKRSGVEDFYIQLDEPHRMFYCPGDVVKGQVNLVLDKPVKTQFVILKLTGMLSVFMGREKVEYSIFEEELLLWGTKILPTSFDRTFYSEDTMEYDTPKKHHQKEEWEIASMEEGEHPFPFELDLPAKSMPSSIDFGKGSITYTIRCIHQRPSTFLGAMRNRSVAQKDIPILDVIDVVAVRAPKSISTRQPDHQKKGKTTGEIAADVELTKAGYLKGEQVRLNIKIRHTKPIKNLKGAIVTLYRLTRFDSPKGEPSTFRKDLAQTISPILCDPRTLDCNVSPRIRIPPDTFPTIKNVKYLSFRYFLEVILDLNPKTTVAQTSSTPQDYDALEEVNSSTSSFIDTMLLMKKNKPFVQSCQFEIVVGTIDSAAKDLESQLQRQEQLLHHYPASSNARRIPMGTFPSAPDLPRRRDSSTSTTSSTASFTRNPPPPFFRGSSVPAGISLAGGPRARSRSASSRASISKSALAEREQALLPSAPPEITSTDLDASAPPITMEHEYAETAYNADAPRIRISHSHESLTALRIEIPHEGTNPAANDDEQYLAALQSRVSAPTHSNRASSTSRIRRRPVSRDLETEEASAPPLDDSTEDNASVSDRVSVASTLPLYTERGYDHS